MRRKSSLLARGSANHLAVRRKARANPPGAGRIPHNGATGISERSAARPALGPLSLRLVAQQRGRSYDCDIRIGCVWARLTAIVTDVRSLVQSTLSVPLSASCSNDGSVHPQPPTFRLLLKPSRRVASSSWSAVRLIPKSCAASWMFPPVLFNIRCAAIQFACGSPCGR